MSKIGYAPAGIYSNDGNTLVGIAHPNGHISPISGGLLPNQEYVRIQSIFRLRLTGTGTVIVDSKDSLGNVTSTVASYTIANATDQIEYPYLGANAIEIRVTLTGTATAEVI